MPAEIVLPEEVEMACEAYLEECHDDHAGYDCGGCPQWAALILAIKRAMLLERADELVSCADLWAGRSYRVASLRSQAAALLTEGEKEDCMNKQDQIDALTPGRFMHPPLPWWAWIRRWLRKRQIRREIRDWVETLKRSLYP